MTQKPLKSRNLIENLTVRKLISEFKDKNEVLVEEIEKLQRSGQPTQLRTAEKLITD